MQFIVRTVGNAVGLWLAQALLTGISLPKDASFWVELALVLAIAAVLTAVQSTVKPLLKVLTFPLYILTFGLFALVINALMLMLSAWVCGLLQIDFVVDGFWSALVGALVVSIIAAIVTALLGPEEKRRSQQ